MRWVLKPNSSEPIDLHLCSFSNLGTAAPRASSAGLLVVSGLERLNLPAWDGCEINLDSGELLLVAAESGTLYVDTDLMQGTLSQGQMCLLPYCETNLRFVPHSACKCIFLTLSGQPAAAMAQSLTEEHIFFRKGIPALFSVISVLEDTDCSPERMSSAAYQLLMYLRLHGEAYRETDGYPMLVMAALGIIQDEFAQIDGVNEIAGRLGVSLNHLVRQFSLYVGMSPGKYLKLRRLEYAKLLLAQPEMTVNLVSDLSGFSNANYFAKVFRKETGMSPSQYKALHQNTGGQSIKKQLDELYL